MRLSRLSLIIAISVGLTACSSLSDSIIGSESSDIIAPAQTKSLYSTAINALRTGNASAARDAAQRLVLADPRSHEAHLLLAASHQLAGDPTSLDLAISGYKASKQFSASNTWASLLAGMASLQRKEPQKALDFFADAIMADPDQPIAFEGLAAAAYASGRLELAQASAKHALALDPNSAIGWRLAVLSAAAKGDQAQVNTMLATPPSTLSATDQNLVTQRSNVLLRTAAFETTSASELPATEATQNELVTASPVNHKPAEVMPGASNQLTVEVTLILSDLRDTTKYGVNLLDNLQSIYSIGRSNTLTSKGSGDDTVVDKAVTITRAIKTPDLSYNLNIFNRGKRIYEVIARPSLTAFAGEPSSFFVGEQLKVGVSGVNTSSLESVDVGVSLKVTPNQIRTDGAQFRIEADRSFFGDQGAGKFSESVALYKQSVSATADVRFGETLILSGLSEAVTDGQESGVPILGDIPGTNLLFHNEAYLKRGRSVLVLVTPSLPVALERTREVSPALSKLVEMWDTVIERQHGLVPLTARLQKSRIFTRMAADDIAVRTISDNQLLSSLTDSFRTSQ